MILTDQEIIRATIEIDQHQGWVITLSRALEAAILAKIGEPVAWVGHSGTLAYSKTSLMPSTRGLATPLYKIPKVK